MSAKSNTNAEASSILAALAARGVNTADITDRTLSELAVTHKRSSLPHSSNPESSAQYYAEKHIGLRRQSSPARRKKLKPIHKKMIALYLAGRRVIDIATECQCTPQCVSDLLGDPLAKEVIQQNDDLLRDEFKRLRSAANQVLRDCMQPTKPDGTRLKAANTFLKASGDLDGGEKDRGSSAEDVIAKILEKCNVENMQINLAANS